MSAFRVKYEFKPIIQLFKGETVTPVVSMLAQEGPMTSESLAEDTKKVLEEITRSVDLFRHTYLILNKYFQ